MNNRFVIPTLILLVIIIGMTAYPVAAFTACSGSSCNATDPSIYGMNGTACSQGSPVTDEYTTYGGLAYVELRLSGLCNTRWTRTTNIGSQAYYIKALLKGFYWDMGYKAANDVIWSDQQYSWPYPGFNWQACGTWSTQPIGDGVIGGCTN